MKIKSVLIGKFSEVNESIQITMEIVNALDLSVILMEQYSYSLAEIVEKLPQMSQDLVDKLKFQLKKKGITSGFRK